MCGIFGAIGTTINPNIIRALALINRERGTDSLGFFDSNGTIVKSASDPLKALASPKIATYLAEQRWFLAGHTRHATHGTVSKRNAHPFQFGKIIGAHNGIVDYPQDRKYQVDSEYLIDQLNLHNGDYQTALSEISGYWGLSWFDGSALHLQAQGNSVYLGQISDGAYYYSSDSEHLAACIGPTDLVKIAGGSTIRFPSPETFDVMPNIVMAPVVTRKSWDTARTSSTKKVIWPKESGELTNAEWNECDGIAVKLGYRDLYDVIDSEGCANERDAYNMLKEAQLDGLDAWADYVDVDEYR